MSVTIHENDQTTTAPDLQTALARLEAKHALNDSELEHLENGESVLLEEDGVETEICITRGE